MNNKESPPSTNPTKKCRALFPYFPSLEGHLAGEHTVTPWNRALIKKMKTAQLMNMEDFCFF
jgi:hypothetical protein